MTPTIHANCLVIGTKGILIRGDSGSGKSLLSDHLIDFTKERGNLGALVSDDRVILTEITGRLVASVPDPIRGKLEVRGFGVVDCAFIEEAAVDLVIDLRPAPEMERFPDSPITQILLKAVKVPSLRCPANDPLTSVRLIRWALRSLFPQTRDYI
ncbi:MAG: HPr kinase/phosphatase C-terminal domain-containing protein [Roseibium sp.]